MQSEELKSIVEEAVNKAVLAYDEQITKRQDYADRCANKTFSQLMKEVLAKLDAMEEAIKENTEWRLSHKESADEIKNFVQFWKYGRKFGIGMAITMTSFGAIFGSIYAIKEWIKN